MSVTTLLFWALLITGVDVLVRYLNKGTPTGDRGSVERILAERYGRGGGPKPRTSFVPRRP